MRASRVVPPPTAIVVVGLAEGGATNPTPPTAATAATVAIVVIAILLAAGTITSPARCPPPAAIVHCKPGALSPPAAIVAGGRLLAVQLLVRALRCRSLIGEAMQARDASVDSARAYASMPPDKAETEGAWVWRWDAAAGGAGDDWVTFLCLLESAAAAATDVARDGVALTVASSLRVGGCLSLFQAAN